MAEPEPSPEENTAKAERQRIIHRLIKEELIGFKLTLATDDLANDFPLAKGQAAKFGRTENLINQVRYQYISALRRAIKERGLIRDIFLE